MIERGQLLTLGLALWVGGGALMAAPLGTDASAARGAWPEPSAPVRPDAKQPYFAFRSTERAGGEGVERLDVSVRPQCRRPFWVFDHAELEVHEQRYARVELSSTPSPGCLACAPLSVRWHYEPAGRLSFSVYVYRRQRVLDCSSQAQG